MRGKTESCIRTVGEKKKKNKDSEEKMDEDDKVDHEWDINRGESSGKRDNAVYK